MRLVLQRADGDCGLAALATYIEATYEDAYAAMTTIDSKRRGKSGVFLKDLMRLSAKMGVPLRLKRRFDLDESEGLLHIVWLDGDVVGLGHMVVLYKGVIVDPSDGEITEAEEFLVKRQARACNLLECAK